MCAFWGSGDFTTSATRLTDPVGSSRLQTTCKKLLWKLKYLYKETTVEPCLFIYMVCISLSSFTVQNMHLEKSCRVNLKFGEEICDRIRDRNTTGLEQEMNQVQSLVAKVMAWKFPLQTGIPAVMVLFVGAWSDKNKRRKILILVPMIGEIITNIGLLFATYYFEELSLAATALIEALPPACTGSYIIIFIGMYSFMADRTSIENRTVRFGVVSIFVSLGTPTGTALSGVALRAMGYYGMFTLLLCLHSLSFLYALLKLQDVTHVNEHAPCDVSETACGVVMRTICTVFGLLRNTFAVVFRKRECNGRAQILLIIVLYLLMVGPLFGKYPFFFLYHF